MTAGIISVLPWFLAGLVDHIDKSARLTPYEKSWDWLKFDAYWWLPLALLLGMTLLYLLWAPYRYYRELNSAHLKLKGKLSEYEEQKLFFSRNVIKDHERGNFKEFMGEISTLCIHGVEDCECRMMGIEFGGRSIMQNSPFPLWWYPCIDPYQRKQVLQGTPVVLYIVGIRTIPDNQFVALHSAHKDKVIAKDGGEIFKETGEYVFTLSITGKGALAVEVKLKFLWTGDFKTSTLEKI